jgi:uncharacterized protein YecE (DUF72 family)
MHWYAGTSGYSYKQWIGSFYPEGMKDDAMLSYYAVHLPAVEINATFHRMPRAQVLEGWADAVPPDFRFAVKASRRITHEQRLVDAGEAIDQLARRLEALGTKLGAVLFQVPSYLHKDAERLRSFFKALPKGLPAAFEFRHASWLDDEVFDLLCKNNHALCVDEANAGAPHRFATADWIYLHLQRPDYSDAALVGTCRRAQTTGARHGFAFFDQAADAAAPAIAARFLSLARDQRRIPHPPRRASRRTPVPRHPESGTQTG